MSKPSPAKQARRKARATKAKRHADSADERCATQERRRKVREAEAAELRRVAIEARAKAWADGAPAREEADRVRRAEREAERATREAAGLAEPPPPPRPRARGGGAMAFLLMAGVLAGADRD